MLELLAQAKPAGGAALDQVAIATGAAGFVTVVLLWLGMGHRSGKVALLGRLGPLLRARLRAARVGWRSRPGSSSSR